MPTVFFETFGCQMNVADSDMLAELLAGRGYVSTDDPSAADLLIVNTCSVRERAERRAQVRIGEYAAAKGRSGRNQTIWVVGCMAERLGERMQAMVPGVDRVIGATRIEHIAHDIDSYLGTIGAETEEVAAAAPLSAFVPVMRGCDNYCAYCVVPFVRGREHSLGVDSVCAKVASLVARGTREVVLLGQNVNSYRDGETSFAGLIRRVHEIEGLERIRFITSHPKDLGDELIGVMAGLPKVCRHIHLPVQSGSTRILKLMNRRYSREDYLRLIGKMRARIPDVDITTDAMVGFPSETDADYRETVSLFEEVGYTSAFMFAYSTREGTAAAAMEGQVDQKTKMERLSRLIGIQTEITRRCYDAMTGATVSVLFTGRQDRRGTAWMGQDRGCKRVLFDCDTDLAGTILPLTVAKSTGMTLIAERS